MKRIGFLWDQVTDPENLIAAHTAARRGKTRQAQVRAVDENLSELVTDLRVTLERGEYRTSGYQARDIVERGKPRTIHRLPYWPDRVVHHALVRVLAPVWRPTLIRTTYASLPGRGIHDAARMLRAQLRSDPEGSRYALKLDVRKHYPSIPHDRLLALLGRQIKDRRVLDLLEEIVRSIDVSAPGVGVPIGNYLSQWFANLYLSPADHRIKEHYRVRYYHRYCDDMVLLGPDKGELHAIRADLDGWLRDEYGLNLKANWQIFPVDDRGIDFLGYRFFHDYTLLRKAMKKRMAAKLSPGEMRRSSVSFARAERSAPAYDGWVRFGSTHDLREKIVVPALSSSSGARP